MGEMKMPSKMSRIRNTFHNAATGGMAFVTELISAINNLHIPAYEDMSEGNTAVFRIANNDSGTETVGGWLVWSFQEVIDQ